MTISFTYTGTPTWDRTEGISIEQITITDKDAFIDQIEKKKIYEERIEIICKVAFFVLALLAFACTIAIACSLPTVLLGIGAAIFGTLGIAETTYQVFQLKNAPADADKVVNYDDFVSRVRKLGDDASSMEISSPGEWLLLEAYRNNMDEEAENKSAKL
jgi:hypothetical protein